MGMAGEGIGQAVFDFGTYDKRIPAHQFANPKRWEHREQMLHVVCALDYYNSPLKEQLKQRLGSAEQGVKRTIEPICGTVAQDVVGSAQGIWVNPGSGPIGPENNYLGLLHDNLDPRIPIFSVGELGAKVGLNYGTYTFTPASSGLVNREFKDIKSDSKIYCFETKPQSVHGSSKETVVILLTMPTPETVHLGKLNGQSCDSPPWEMKNYTEFER